MSKEYIRICSEEYANQHSFLFWKPEGIGYTDDINKAGLFEDEKRDSFFSIKKSVLLKYFKVITIVEGSFYNLKKVLGKDDSE